MPAGCRLCGADKTAVVTNEGDWQVFECAVCGFVFVVPLPDEEYLKAHYQQYLPADEKKIGQWRNLMEDISRRSLEAIEKHRQSPSQGKLLDVGCGYGFFLERARDRGWTVHGVEPCVHARDHAMKSGLQVDLGGLLEQQYPDASFDIVTMFYVLEHVREPLSYLKEAYRILKPGGLLLVRVPHTTPIVKFLKAFGIKNRLYDTPSHLSDFSPKTLSLALRKAGFDGGMTFPGGATRPPHPGERVVATLAGWIADALYWISFGKWLLPGVSKSTLTKKKL
ncbi:MAG: class I SAM-dependent methyltransferase [Candidatus Omnitrophica bacterium]|nr:class I SAM-dependent methyltransferase [Candidatus Omnitrophota bacterium]